jgi:hypothetical protein
MKMGREGVEPVSVPTFVASAPVDPPDAPWKYPAAESNRAALPSEGKAWIRQAGRYPVDRLGIEPSASRLRSVSVPQYSAREVRPPGIEPGPSGYRPDAPTLELWASDPGRIRTDLAGVRDRRPHREVNRA